MISFGALWNSWSGSNIRPSMNNDFPAPEEITSIIWQNHHLNINNLLSSSMYNFWISTTCNHLPCTTIGISIACYNVWWLQLFQKPINVFDTCPFHRVASFKIKLLNVSWAVLVHIVCHDYHQSHLLHHHHKTHNHHFCVTLSDVHILHKEYSSLYDESWEIGVKCMMT